MSGVHADSTESVSTASTPLGVTVVSLIVAVYGLLWLLASFTAIYAQSDPNFFAFMGPFLGLSLLLIAIGLWDLKWSAWVLTMVIIRL